MSSDEESTYEESHEAWVKIQESTFANWANDKLRSHGISVNHLQKDLRDGVKLCALVESLLGHKIGKVISRKNMNYYEASGNIHMALQAVKQSGIRLVNIGAEDITRGNLKLILGLMWLLIRRFQIGSQSSLPPKKMMLAWANAVLHPHVTVHNFSSDWNDSKALKGIIEYCAPGTFPDWMNSNTTDRLGNCEEALDMAEKLFGIPLVVTAGNFSSSDLDELSGMTYLSYFMTVKSPGYNATLNWIREAISPHSVNNFEEDWNDGTLVTHMVTSMGADVSCDSDEPISRCESAMSASKQQLGISPVIESSEMISPRVHHIGVMAYVAWHQRKVGGAITVTPVALPPVYVPTPPIVHVKSPVEKQVKFSTAPLITVNIADTWPTLATSTIIVDTSKADGDAPITASALHHASSCSINELVVSKVSNECQHIEFTPTVKGEWKVSIQYDGVDLADSPFTVNSYDVKFARLEKRMAQTNHNEYSFLVNLEDVGLNELDISVLYLDDVVEPDIVNIGPDEYKITFSTSLGFGVYTVMAYCGGVKIPGSPFEVTVESMSNVVASGDGLTAATTNQKSTFEVDFTEDVGKKLEVVIERPDERGELPTNVENKRSGVIQVEYIPQEAGVHVITLVYDGLPLKESPYRVQVNTKHVRVSNIDDVAYLGKKSMFQIDASEMSKGTLEIDGNLPVQNYQKIGDNIYEVTFLPKKIGTIDFTIKYNDKLLEDCPYTIQVRR